MDDIGPMTMLELAQNGIMGERESLIVMEVLNKRNALVSSIPFIPCNDGSGHNAELRTKIPTPSWGRLYQGMNQDRSAKTKIRFTTGFIEITSEIDVRSVAGWSEERVKRKRMDELNSSVEGFMQEAERALFYESELVNPERITGLAPHFDRITKDGSGSGAKTNNSKNIIDAGGTGTDNSSIWITSFSPTSLHGIYPESTTPLLEYIDRGVQRTEDDNNKPYYVYATELRMYFGLALPDWRYTVRICNISQSALTFDAATGPNLPSLVRQGLKKLPQTYPGLNGSGEGKMTRIFLHREVDSYFTEQRKAPVAESTLTMEDDEKVSFMQYGGIPIINSDGIKLDEARIR